MRALALLPSTPLLRLSLTTQTTPSAWRTPNKVALHRTIGHKDDEFFLQCKRATKNNVVSGCCRNGYNRPDKHDTCEDYWSQLFANVITTHFTL